MLYIIFKRFLCCIIFFLFTSPASAQEYIDDFKALNAFYLEAGGNGDGLSLNYDRIIYQRMNFKSAFRAGVGTNFFFLESEPSAYPVIPVELLALVGQKSSYLEFGLGYSRRLPKGDDLVKDLYFARIGLRYQAPRGGLLVRIGFTPFLAASNNESSGAAIKSRFGVSIGHSF